MGKRAVFLDRDGVLNAYLPGDYVKTPDELTLLPGVGAAIARLNVAGFQVALISNQQGVAKGVMSAADLDSVTAKLVEAIAADGGRIDSIHYCVDPASENSPRRKPAPGMILEAVATLDVDVCASVFVGDTLTDSQAARAANVGCFVLVLSGQNQSADGFDPAPDFVAADLSDAVDFLLRP